MTLHVAIVCPYSYGRPGGVQEHTRGLARALRDHGYGVTLLAPDMGRGADGLSGIVTVSLGRSVAIPANGSVAPVGVDPRMLPRLELALDAADVVHLHEPFQPACIAAMLRTPKGIPCVGTFHAAADRFAYYAVTRPLVRRLARRLAMTTASSDASRALIRRYVALDPLIVPNGVDMAEFTRAAPDDWMRSLGTTVLFVGRSEPRKGHDVALRVFDRVAPSRPDVHFVSNVPATDAVARDRAHFLGPQPRERLVSLFKAADVYVAPNLGRESFGVILLEALAAECAVLASDIPGFRSAGGDAVRYAPAGDVAEWAAELCSLLDDEQARRSLSELGVVRAREFDWRVVVARMMDVYERALSVL